MGQSTTLAPSRGPKVERRRKSTGLRRWKKPLMKLLEPPTQLPDQKSQPEPGVGCAVQPPFSSSSSSTTRGSSLWSDL